MNSLLGATFLEKPIARKRRRYNWPERRMLDSLSTISALYIYTEPAPNGYVTPAPKVAETVLRAWQFNLKKENRTKVIGDYKVNWAVWENEDHYPFGEITGNWHPGEAHQMYRKMLKDNFRDITTICQKTMELFLITNSDILTRGRQTWDSIKGRSVPSPAAYQEMANLFQLNLGKEASNCLEWIQMYFECMNLDSIRTKKKRVNVKIKTVFDKGHKQRVNKTKKMISYPEVTIKGRKECSKYMFDLSRDFCLYIKHGERAKLNRPAIASPNMIKRMFFKIIFDRIVVKLLLKK